MTGRKKRDGEEAKEQGILRKLRRTGGERRG
jgi:hypothetical protein